MKEINLISAQKKKLFGFYQQTKQIKTLVVIFNFLVVLLMGGLFLIYLNTTDQFKKNESKIKALSNEINFLNQKETYLVSIDDRLKQTSQILKTRTSKEELFTKIKKLFVPGFVFSSMELSGAGVGKIAGYCQDSLCLADIYSVAEDLKKQDPFTEFSFNGINWSPGNSFEITIALKN